MYKENDTTIWLGYLKGGASKFDGSNFTHYNQQNQLGNATIESITSNKNGTVFFSTSEKGIFCLRDNKFTNITTKDGLSSNITYSILADPFDENRLWVGTPKGLNLVKFDAHLKVKSVKNYTEENGLFGTSMGENLIMLDSHKNIWVGGAEGFSIFNPTLERPNSAPPNLNLTNIRLYFQNVNWMEYTTKVDEKTGLPIELKLDYKNQR